MKNIAPALKAHLASGSTSLCRLWTMRLKGGRTLRYADGSNDVFFSGNLYTANPGIEISAIRDSSTNGFADAEITSILSPEQISEDMVKYRLMKDATFSIVMVDYEQPNLGAMYLFGGIIGDYTIKGINVSFEAKGGGDAVSEIVLGEYYSERCRNVFGDKRCRVNKKLYGVPFEVTGVDPLAPYKFYCSVVLPDGEIENVQLGSIQTEEDDFGSGKYVVPDTDQFTVTLAGGGAIETTGFKNGDLIINYPGADGHDATFAGMTAFGGIDRASRVGAYVPAEDGAAQGGDTNTAGGAQNGRVSDFSPVRWSGKGSGGLCAKTYFVGPGKDFQVGQEINYNLGDGSDGKTTGRIKIVSRRLITTITQGYKFASVTWNGGDNVGYTHSVVSIDNKQLITLTANLNKPIQIGDKGTFDIGCSNYRSNCKVFKNLPRFRAEPDAVVVPKDETVQSNLIPDPVKVPAGNGFTSMNFAKA